MSRLSSPRCIFVSAITLIFVVSTILSGCSGGSSGVQGGPTSQYVSGQVIYTDKLAGATVKIYDASGSMLLATPVVTGSEGLYDIPSAGLPPVFTIVVTGGQTPDGNAFTGYLKRVVNNYSADAYYEVNGLTTLVAVYMERHPGAGYDSAVTAVRTYLALPDNDTFAAVSAAIFQSAAWFSDIKFWDMMTGSDYTAFIDAIMQDIDASRVVNLADASRTADLPTLLDSGEWGVRAAVSAIRPTAALKAKATTAKSGADPISAVLGIVGGVFEGAADIMDMQEEEANVETLNRIDDNINKIMSQLSDIKAQTDRIEGILVEDQWSKANDELRKLELGCIAPAREAMREVLLQKRTMAAMSPPERSSAKSILQDKIDRFNMLMEKKSCGGLSIGSYEDVLDTYANTVTRLDSEKEKSAIQLYANVLNTKSNDPTNCKDCTYQSIENTFLRFIYYQTTTMQLYLHYVLNKTAKADWPRKKQEIVDRFLKGTDEYDYERMIKQVGRFVPAVESFVVSHDNEKYYKRWMQCDVVNSLASGYGVSCADYERPFLRSQVITDQLTGSLRNKDGAIAGKKYGFFLKAIQLQVSGVKGLEERKFYFGTTKAPWSVTVLPSDTRVVAGKNPYRYLDESAMANWQVATYRIEGSEGQLTFDVGNDNEGNDTATPVYFRDRTTLNEVRNASLGKSYNTFTAWTVPIRDLTHLQILQDMGFGMYNYYPIHAYNCWNECTVQPWADTQGTRLRFYKLGAEKQNAVIAFRSGGRRYILLPSETMEWAGGCGSTYTVQAYWSKDIVDSDGNSRISWSVEPSGWNARIFSFYRKDLEGARKVLCHFNAVNRNILYGWDSCLSTKYGFEPVYDGDWR
ncbi:MAG: hypothetical protein CSYNP_02073 [Syntrophus sp. SKADARSKE-3]|nr:hypothetical protein [Syntrophus sp. SKADARSKE-3]